MRRKLLQALTAGLVLATATGCTYEDFPRLGMPTPTTEEAPRILSLWQGSWAAALAVGVLVWGLILWSAIFHRRSRTKVEVPPQTRYNMPIEALYTVVPLIIVSVLFYFTARDESKLLSLKKNPDVTINVVGFQWNWGFNYIEPVDGSTGDAKTDKNLDAIPNRFKDAFPADAGGVYDVGTPATRNPQNGNPGPTLWLPKGKTVRFVLTSRDVIHSFWVVPFLMKQDVIPGPHQRLRGDSRQGGHLHGQVRRTVRRRPLPDAVQREGRLPRALSAAPQGPRQEGADRLRSRGHRADGP